MSTAHLSDIVASYEEFYGTRVKTFDDILPSRAYKRPARATKYNEGRRMTDMSDYSNTVRRCF